MGTKLGCRGPQEAGAFTLCNLRVWTYRSRANRGVEALGLGQLHSPPHAVFASKAVFDVLDILVNEGRIASYGVSAEPCAQALSAISRPNAASVQIIPNVSRRNPLEQALPAAEGRGGHHRPGSTGLRPVGREVPVVHGLRRERPP